MRSMLIRQDINFIPLYASRWILLVSKTFRYGTCWRGITLFHVIYPHVESTTRLQVECVYFSSAEYYRILPGNHFPSRWEQEAELAWVAGYMHTKMVYLWTITHVSTNRARRRATLLMCRSRVFGPHSFNRRLTLYQLPTLLWPTHFILFGVSPYSQPCDLCRLD